MRSRSNCGLVLVLSLALAVMAACAPKSHEERVAGLRSYYKVMQTRFIIEAEPMSDELPAESADAAGDSAAAAAEAVSAEVMEGEEMPAAEEVPIRQSVLLDILLQHDSPEKLPGITLDIEMADSNQNTKNTWRIWVETANLPKATGMQFTHLLEDVDYVVGDGFNVEVRSPVPPEERSEYREFSEPAGG